MTAGAGVVRSAVSLDGAGRAVDDLARLLARAVGPPDGEAALPAGVATGELANLATVARALLASAIRRTESRGAHARAEFPRTDPNWRRRLVHAGPSVVSR